MEKIEEIKKILQDAIKEFPTMHGHVEAWVENLYFTLWFIENKLKHIDLNDENIKKEINFFVETKLLGVK